MYYPGLIISLAATSLIPPNRIVLQDGDASCDLAVDASAPFLGVSEQGGEAPIGSQCDILTTRIAPVEYGGDVAVNDPLTADATGRAIKAAPAAGETLHIIGHATVSGDEDTIGAVNIGRGIVFAPAA